MANAAQKSPLRGNPAFKTRLDHGVARTFVYSHLWIRTKRPRKGDAFFGIVVDIIRGDYAVGLATDLNPRLQGTHAAVGCVISQRTRCMVRGKIRLTKGIGAGAARAVRHAGHYVQAK